MKKATTRPFREAFEELMQDPVFKTEWEASANERAITRSLIEARIKHKLTQRQLAKRIGIKQPSLARIERGTHLPSSSESSYNVHPSTRCIHIACIHDHAHFHAPSDDSEQPQKKSMNQMALPQS